MHAKVPASRAETRDEDQLLQWRKLAIVYSDLNT
jgi:hypothetical protein